VSAVLTAQEPSAKYLVNLQPPLVRHFDLIAQAPGGVARLRELILTLAVQGKLVPQDPSDEPAIELLKKIRTEKDRLIAEGKIKRDKALAEIADEEKPFELPISWEWCRLGAVTTYGSSAKAATIKPETWVLDLEDVEKGTGKLLNKSRFSERPALSDKNVFFAGDVLYGKLRPYLNKVLVADEDGICTTEIVPLRCYGPYEPGYFAIALRTPFFLEYVNALSYGMKMPRLGTEDGRKALLPLPPLAEQSRIVTRVQELMQVCDALEASGQLEAQQHAQLVNTLLGTLTQSETPEALADNWQRIASHFDVLLDRPEAVDALEQTILQLAVRGLLVPQDPTDEPASILLQKIRTEKNHLIAQGTIKRDKPLPPITDEEKPFELPQGWALARFGDLAQISSGVTLGRKTPISKPLLLPYLRVANVQRWTLKLKSMKEVIIDEKELGRFQICSGDLLITEGGDWDKVGRTAIWRDQLPTCLHQNHVFKARGVTAEWCPEWAELYLNSDIARSYFAASAKQTTNLASINMTELKNCVFPLPSSFEQSRIVSRVNELRSLCVDLRQRLAAGQTVQSRLADALVTG
jgi:type I restriction enzyme S subunit